MYYSRNISSKQCFQRSSGGFSVKNGEVFVDERLGSSCVE